MDYPRNISLNQAGYDWPITERFMKHRVCLVELPNNGFDRDTPVGLGLCYCTDAPSAVPVSTRVSLLLFIIRASVK